MLFSGLACFSPSVAPTIRKLWVKNGGTLTHTNDDFRRANFFFCDGMDDPWLNELLSRRLIVRHASWVTLCVAEDFCMPIAAYTLDDGFDITKIRVLEPPGALKVAQADIATIGTLVNSMEVPADILKNTKAISRKRPFDNIDDSFAHSEEEQWQQKPRKKARIDLHSLVFPELYVDSDHQSPKTQLVPLSTRDGSALKSDIQVPRLTNIFPTHSGKASRAISQRFLSQIRQISTDCPNDISALNPFSLFWNDLLETHLSEKSSAPLTLSVEDLLRAPSVRATVFAVNTDYLGRTFANSDPASQWVPMS